ncbi:MAG: hypothetical protein ACU0A0_01135 [Limimaricola sp.]
MLGYTLTLGDFDAWDGFTQFLIAKLKPVERGALAWAALRSLEPEHAEATAETVLGGAEGPYPPFLDPMRDARFWASLASRRVRKAYALAAFESLSAKDQAAFLDHVTDRRAEA